MCKFLDISFIKLIKKNSVCHNQFIEISNRNEKKSKICKIKYNIINYRKQKTNDRFLMYNVTERFPVMMPKKTARINYVNTRTCTNETYTTIRCLTCFAVCGMYSVYNKINVVVFKILKEVWRILSSLN